jgi:hypothetical protein
MPYLTVFRDESPISDDSHQQYLAKKPGDIADWEDAELRSFLRRVSRSTRRNCPVRSEFRGDFARACVREGGSIDLA